MLNSRMAQELSEWLVLYHALKEAPQTLKSLLNAFHSPRCILKKYRDDPTALPLTDQQRQRLCSVDQRAIEKELKWCDSRVDQHIITLHDSDYPNWLKEIYDPPCVLYVKGNKQCLSQAQIAIVGSRNPSVDGRMIAFDFAEELSRLGLVVTSGLAIGIDASAHQGALSVAMSPTIGVLGSGVDVIYPKQHKTLANTICATGALISEQPLQTPPLPRHFPKRNRIISGLSLATVVIEASLRSGSLITARLANEQGRDVFAVPSSIRNPLASGCHHLIKNGAKLTEGVADILDELRICQTPVTQPRHSISIINLDHSDRKLLECLGCYTKTVQNLIDLTGLSSADLTSRLLNLELQGYVKATSGGYCREAV